MHVWTAVDARGKPRCAKVFIYTVKMLKRTFHLYRTCAYDTLGARRTDTRGLGGKSTTVHKSAAAAAQRSKASACGFATPNGQAFGHSAAKSSVRQSGCARKPAYCATPAGLLTGRAHRRSGSSATQSSYGDRSIADGVLHAAGPHAADSTAPASWAEVACAVAAAADARALAAEHARTVA